MSWAHQVLIDRWRHLMLPHTQFVWLDNLLTNWCIQRGDRGVPQ